MDSDGLAFWSEIPVGERIAQIGSPTPYLLCLVLVTCFCCSPPPIILRSLSNCMSIFRDTVATLHQ